MQVRSVSPFSDPSSNLYPFSRCGAVRFAAGQDGPDYPCVLIGDRHRCTVIFAPQAKFIDPHTPRIGFSHSRSDDGSGAMYKQGPQVLAAALADAHHYGRSPLECWRGTSPSQAARWRPFLKSAPLPIAGIIAVEVFGPMPPIWQSSGKLRWL